MQLQGKIKRVLETQQVTASFKKREFVVTTQEQYPQDVILEFTQDKCDVLDRYKEGAEVEVHFNLRGRSFTDKNGIERTFNTLQAWKIGALNTLNQDNFDNVPTPPIEEGEDDGFLF